MYIYVDRELYIHIELYKWLYIVYSYSYICIVDYTVVYS